ncbi:MAG TPA: glycine cleavage system aminomethyltransferase GcvT [Chloroflexota bacterium]|nr:glycine cleavage system aminomethyltransferase GcvT [Chloroflexota bacterium]
MVQVAEQPAQPGVTAAQRAEHSPVALQKTPLHQVHVDLGARMVPFGGWDMPVQYPTGVLAEHHAVRERAGLFDIGHMGQLNFDGPDALEFLQWVTTHDVSRLKVGAAQYSLLCNEGGTVIDDIIVYRLAETRYLMIVNASNTDADCVWLEQQLKHPGRGVNPDNVLLRRVSPQQTLLALQGPQATAVLRRVAKDDPGELANYHAMESTVAGIPAVVARTGYTGERGYEIGFDGAHAALIWNALLEAGREEGIIPCGLGARDTLRLEAGMALYGHELTDLVNPYEAKLDRVVRHEKGDFLGAVALRRIQETGPQRRLVGIELIDRGVPRPDYPILADGKPVGTLTSGGPSPTLKKSIGMGLVPVPYTAEGTEVQIEIRGKPHAARVVPLPFYKRMSPSQRGKA